MVLTTSMACTKIDNYIWEQKGAKALRLIYSYKMESFCSHKKRSEITNMAWSINYDRGEESLPKADTIYCEHKRPNLSNKNGEINRNKLRVRSTYISTVKEKANRCSYGYYSMVEHHHWETRKID